jgi:hypothetical protein
MHTSKVHLRVYGTRSSTNTTVVHIPRTGWCSESYRRGALQAHQTPNPTSFLVDYNYKMAQVHNGVAFEEVVGGAGNTAAQSPVPPVADGDGSIFISIPTFRGTSLSNVCSAFAPPGH